MSSPVSGCDRSSGQTLTVRGPVTLGLLKRATYHIDFCRLLYTVRMVSLCFLVTKYGNPVEGAMAAKSSLQRVK